jgi:hypothetical protein
MVPTPENKPPKIVSTARFSNNRNRLDYRPMVALPFTAKKFLRCCLAMNAYWDSPAPLGNSEALKLVMDIISVMSYKQIDVLEFLMNDCGFFWLFLHSLTPRHRHLIIDLKTIDSVITESNLPLGFFHRSGPKQIPPYPPNKWGLKFSPADFVRWMVAAEAEISQFDFNESEGLKSFDVLHKQVHRISGLGIEYADFTSGYEPAEGTPGAVIYCYLEKADEAAFPCEWFNAEVASNGKPEPFLSALYSTQTQLNLQLREQEEELNLMTKDEATTFVDALAKVDVAGIPRDAIRCGHCWSNFDVEEGINNSPVRLPCDDRHVLGRGCLVEILSSLGPLCSMCRVNIVVLRSESS